MCPIGPFHFTLSVLMHARGGCSHAPLSDVYAFTLELFRHFADSVTAVAFRLAALSRRVFPNLRIILPPPLVVNTLLDVRTLPFSLTGSMSFTKRVPQFQGRSNFKEGPVSGRLIVRFAPVLALYDPFGVDVPLNLDITHSPVSGRHVSLLNCSGPGKADSMNSCNRLP